eukprot:scaffold1769_cov132-Skeletonema_dohrnii-CCMP3373.AAC.18
MKTASAFLLSSILALASTAKGFVHLSKHVYTNRNIHHGTLQMSNDDAAASNLNDSSKVCLVTGASRGIGKCIALELSKAGDNVNVVINDIEPMKEEAEQLCQQIKDAGGDAMVVTADCELKAREIESMFQQIIDKYGTVDILVNNAGIARDGLVIRMKPEQWQQVIDVNLSGVFYASQEFLKEAVKRKSGCIVNIASVVGQIGNPGQANYAAAKAGVIGLTKATAQEYASRGIRVNAVCPGYIATPMTATLGDDFLEKICQKIPLGRLGKPEEVAGTVRFLALDPAAQYMTGHCYDVDGGIAMTAA